ncbi:MAG TPA: hypothetical protein PLS37_10105 [Propioniciclava tarda]|nr:hypothetical protein [Propioniciclava tarda]
MSRRALATLALVFALVSCSTPSAPSSPTTPVSPPPRPSATGQPSASDTPRADGLVKWPDNSKVSHIFFHSLVVDTDRGFDPKRSTSAGIEQYMVTQYEFNKILDSLYAKGYVLVHPQRLAAKDASGVMKWTPLYLPAGKTPLVLSVDDMSYNKVTVGNGFATRLTLTPDGKVTNDYTDAAGNTTQGAYDVTTVLDEFVAKHPDFSFEGDKGTIALTGYEGVLGYKSSPYVYGDNDTTKAEAAKAKAVADALKASGWKFASHSYGHRNYTKFSVGAIQKDMGTWLADVSPIIGKTDMLIYAFGADISDVKPYTKANPKYAYLSSVGFDYFFNVDGSTPAWMQLQPGSLRQGRINIDGITLSRAIQGKTKILDGFFDPKAVLDPKRPMPTPGT